MIDSAKHKLTREEREKRHLALADDLEHVSLDLLPRNQARSDEIHLMIQKELRELDLLPREPLGTDYFIYIEQLVKPLRAGVKETQDFVKNWKGRRY